MGSLQELRKLLCRNIMWKTILQYRCYTAAKVKVDASLQSMLMNRDVSAPAWVISVGTKMTYFVTKTPHSWVLARLPANRYLSGTLANFADASGEAMLLPLLIACLAGGGVTATSGEPYHVAGENSPYLGLEQHERPVHVLQLGNLMGASSSTSDTTLGSMLHNKVFVLPEILTEQECEELIREADMLLDVDGEKSYRRDRYGAPQTSTTGEESSDEDEGSALRRLSLDDMSATAQLLSMQILKERVLPRLQAQVPGLCESAFAESGAGSEVATAPERGVLRLANVRFDFATDEPTVNRYMRGGRFEAHEDGYSLTVIILLNSPDNFEGGGTSFWPPPTGTTVLIHPPRGAAVLFDGITTHAGAPVVDGTRHVYVASFDLVPVQGGAPCHDNP